MINKVILIGNLGSDPQTTTFENGSQVNKFSVATNENYKNKTTGEWETQTEWHDVVKWKNIPQSLKKGSLVYIEGKLTHRKWQDKDGNNRYSTEVVAAVVRMLEKKEGIESFPSAEPKTDNDDDMPF